MLLLATVVGCNYPGTRSELRGCVNDALAMRDTLVQRFGFRERNITLLIDEDDDDDNEGGDYDDDDDDDDGALLPTGANIKRALFEMVQRACGVRSTAQLFFYFSGHGTLLRGGPYARRRHEAIVPCDHNLITDVDFRRLVDQVPQNATFTMVSDSCHSGGLIAQEREQVGPTAGRRALGAGGTAGRTRFLPCEAVLQHLGVAHLHQLEGHMVASFGDDASALFCYAQAQAPVPRPRPDTAILLSACQSDELAKEHNNRGVFTSALVALLQDRNFNNRMPLSNWEVVTMARDMLQQRGYTQHPCLYCGENYTYMTFLLKGTY